MKKIALLLIFISTLCSCEINIGGETEEKLTPITNTGERTFSCKINRDIFKKQTGIIFGGDLGFIKFEPNNDSLWMHVSVSRRQVEKDTNDILYNSDIEFSIPQIKEGEFQINKNSQLARYCFKKGVNGRDTCLRSADDYGVLRIHKFDVNSRIVSGTFAFKTITPDGTIYNISEGRFDMKF